MHDATIQPAEDLRICSACVGVFPVTEFRRRSKATAARMSDCKRCHAAHERQRRHRREQQANSLAAQKTASRVATSRNVEKAANVVNLMVARLGGTAKFFDWWIAEIDRIQAQRRVTVRSLRFCELVLNFHNLDSASGATRAYRRPCRRVKS